MPSNRKTYFIIPSSDYKPNDQIKLGQLITDPLTPYRPIADPLSPLPQIRTAPKKQNYSFEKSQAESGSASIFTEALGIISLLTGDISGNLSKEISGTWKTPELHTQFIEPSDEYIDKATKKDEVQKFLKGVMGKPVYMITGIKVARDADVKTEEGNEFGGEVKVAGDGSGAGVPVKAGTTVSYSKKNKETETYSVKEPFVMAIRMRKIFLKWGNLRSEEHRGGELAGRRENYSSDEDDDDEDEEEDDTFDEATLEQATVELEDFGNRALPPGFKRIKVRDDSEEEQDCQLMYHFAK